MPHTLILIVLDPGLVNLNRRTDDGMADLVQPRCMVVLKNLHLKFSSLYHLFHLDFGLKFCFLCELCGKFFSIFPGFANSPGSVQPRWWSARRARTAPIPPLPLPAGVDRLRHAAEQRFQRTRQSGGIQQVSHTQAASGDVHREVAIRVGQSFGGQRAGFTGTEDAQRFQRLQFFIRIGIVHLAKSSACSGLRMPAWRYAIWAAFWIYGAVPLRGSPGRENRCTSRRQIHTGFSHSTPAFSSDASTITTAPSTSAAAS